MCHSQHQGRLFLFALQEWEEGFREGEAAQVIGPELRLDCVQVDCFRLGEVDAPLNARIEQNAVEVAICACDAKTTD